MRNDLRLTRRQLCIATAGIFGSAAFAMFGCSNDTASNDGDSTSLPGFASDCVVRTYPVTLKIYVDSDLQYSPENFGASGYVVNGNRLDQLAYYYQTQNNRSDVSFDFVYVNPSDLLEMVCMGFPDGDAIIALEDTVNKGAELGTCDGGVADLSIRNLSNSFRNNVVLVRALGSDVELPPAATLSGEDDIDATGISYNQIQQIPDFDGLIAISDPETTTEGSLFLRILWNDAGLFTYDEGSTTSGTFDASIADKIVIYPTQEEAMEAVVSGECQLGVAMLNKLRAGLYPQVEECYTPPKNGIQYSGIALIDAPEPGVARDFFEAASSISW